jgi:carbamate kinase
MALILVAVGGNALIRTGQIGSAAEQLDNARRTARDLLRLLEAGHRLVVTHGNGPQVGAALARSEHAASEVYRLPYDACVAATQGEIGYALQHALWEALETAGRREPVVTLITQVVIDPADPAVSRPSKPVGPRYERQVAERHRDALGWSVAEQEDGSWRRTVPSPRPLRIVELPAVRACVERGVLVIVAGGGGIPVREHGEQGRTLEAVIDKDRTASLLGQRLGVDLLLIVTAEPAVFVDFGQRGQRPLGSVTTEECRRLLAEGQFPAGSMGPKVESAVEFVERTGREAVITDLASLVAAAEGRAGTRVAAA